MSRLRGVMIRLRDVVGAPAPAAGSLAALAVLALGALTTPLPARAQERAVPLTKSEIVRLLAGGTYGEDERVAIVSRACLSFVPTDRDLETFRKLGASDPFFAAVRACRNRGVPLEVRMSTDEATARAGDTVAVLVVALREGRPVAGAGLALEDRAGGRADGGRVETDREGRARFRIPAGTRPGTRTFRVVGRGAPLEGRPEIVLRVRPGAPAAVRTDIEALVLLEGRTDRERIEVEVTDAFGNPVPTAEVEARTGRSGTGSVVARGVSDAGGFVVLEPPVPAVAGAERIELWSRGRRIGTLPVRRIPAAEASAGFVEGTGQTGPPGEPLPEPVVFELRDGAGRPVPDQPVAFRSVEGRVFPETARTDTAGRVAVRVWLAGHGARTGVVAAAGAVEANVTLAPFGGATAGGAGEGPLREEASARVRGRDGGAAGDVRDDLDRLREAARRAPSDPAVWTELAGAWIAAGRPEEARIALLLGREQVDAAGRPVIDRGLVEIGGLPPALRIGAWGGDTFDAADGGGLRGLELSFRPATSVRAWARYDESLELQLPALTRGPDVMEGYYAGAEIEWGEDARLATAVEIGRREQVEEVDELLYRVEQGIRIATAAGPAIRARFGGVLGRWFDRDDWIAYTRWEIPVSLAVDVVPALYVGETLGTDLAAAGREPATEARAHLGLDARPSPRWRIRPTVGVGQVESDREELTGILMEGMVRVDVTVVGTSRLQLFARHQSAPGSDPFTVVAAGLAVGVP